MIPVSCTPTGASVEVDGRTFEAPCVLKLARKHDHRITISHAGYVTEVRNLARKPTGAIRGNIWVGGLIGLIVDLCTGADNDLVPDHVEVTLAAIPSEEAPRHASRLELPGTAARSSE